MHWAADLEMSGRGCGGVLLDEVMGSCSGSPDFEGKTGGGSGFGIEAAGGGRMGLNLFLVAITGGVRDLSFF